VAAAGERSASPGGLRHDMLRRLAANRFYRHTLFGRVPPDLRPRAAQRWPGDAKRGGAIVAGEIELEGEVVRHPAPRWFPAAAGPDWLAAWHGFGWLPDVLSSNGGAAAGRDLVRGWLGEAGGWHPVGWRCDVLATRICSWIAHLDEIAGRDHEHALRRAMLASLVAQLAHLARTAAWEQTGAARIRALKGLIVGTAALGGPANRMARALRALDREIARQILDDGGHVSRNPSLQLRVLQDLIDIRAAMRAAQLQAGAALDDAIARMAPILRMFRHGDRRLALFNDALEEDGVLIDLVLTRSETRGSPPAYAPDIGFDRLQAGNSLVLLDTGAPPPRGFDTHAHAGTLSLEMSCDRERIIVNCGAYRGPRSNWSQVARASAAHSVLVVADRNSVEIRDDGSIGRTPATITRERTEHDGQHWISASHDGYRERFGLSYTRELFLAADGADLRGEEKLTGLPGANFAVRFHLHPAVEAALLDDNAGASLRLPSGALWRLRVAGAEVSLGESIYLGSGEARKTQQIILSGAVEPAGATVRWALRREPRPAAGG
jgi:uncharacterized heparinase superfamily protein